MTDRLWTIIYGDGACSQVYAESAESAVRNFVTNEQFSQLWDLGCGTELKSGEKESILPTISSESVMVFKVGFPGVWISQFLHNDSCESILCIETVP
jgi:hypothetical protein